jgi:SlyX protein
MTSPEDRLIELEMRAAYQEDALHTLGEELARQKREIEALVSRLRELQSRVDSGGEGIFRGTAQDEVPPHY